MYPHHDYQLQKLLLEERREQAGRQRKTKHLLEALRLTGGDGPAPAPTPDLRRRRGRRWAGHTRPRPAT